MLVKSINTTSENGFELMRQANEEGGIKRVKEIGLTEVKESGYRNMEVETSMRDARV